MLDSVAQKPAASVFLGTYHVPAPEALPAIDGAARHPSLERLSTPKRIRAEQEVTRRYGAIMPFWMSSVIVLCLPVLALARGTSAFLLTLAGTACFVGMLASTLTGNVPINKRVLELSPETDGEEFVELRKRWDRLHTLRVFLNVAGLALLCLGALQEDLSSIDPGRGTCAPLTLRRAVRLRGDHERISLVTRARI